MKIDANATGTRTIEVTEEQMQTIRKYMLFERIADSMGIVDESALEKLRCTVRSLIASQEEDSKALLKLCLVLYDDNMKSLGLKNLISCYKQWESRLQDEDVTTESETSNA